MMKYINLERGEHGSIRQAYEKAGEWLRSGVSVLFFPEGTRSNSEEMNPFKNGAFKLAIKEKRPILPIVLHGSRNVIPRGSWIFKVRTESSLIVLPEVDTSNYTEEDFAKLRDLVYNMLKEAYKNANDHRPDFSRPAAG
jgi:1-acyl-sn-glycerol-3-phosphate acyltransferase